MLLHPAKGASWEVKSRSIRCFKTETDFEEGNVILSRLVQTNEGMQRQDFLQQVWDDGLKADALFYWKTTFRLPPLKKEEPFKEENAEEFLREMIEKNDPALVNTVFILAVMLERKRLLIERGVQKDPDGRRVRIYEHKDSGETFFIVDPDLSLDQVAAVQEEVALALGWIVPEEDKEGEPDAEASSEEEDEEAFDAEDPDAEEE
jgi:hypothetical protein